MRELTRREGLGLSLLTLAAAQMREAGASSHPPVPRPVIPAAGFLKEDMGSTAWMNVHEGVGSLGVQRHRFGDAAHPAHFIIYDIPPGASEGTHVHLPDNSNQLGVFDEFYFILSGEGRMEINGAHVPVRAGDHVFTPIGVPHGIENHGTSGNLKVFLTFVERPATA
jgi:mannose-6-phosphate isomerase-like protein (cupin superfamily)